jgi:hypothetical protein
VADQEIREAKQRIPSAVRCPAVPRIEAVAGRGHRTVDLGAASHRHGRIHFPGSSEVVERSSGGRRDYPLGADEQGAVG